jgi:LacI family transcriptional regulator
MPTIKDVAEKAGVSIATVSHIINGTRYVSEELTVKVRAIIEALEYEPHAVARSLRGQKTHMIGLILPDNTNPFFAEVARGVEDTCFNAGYSVILCNSDNNIEKEVSYLRLLENKGIDGIAFVSIGQDHEAVEMLAKQKHPHVLIDRFIPDFNIDSVLVDNRGGARLAIESLVKLGHKRIGFISGPADLISSQERERGFRETMDSSNLIIQQSDVSEGDFGLRSGETAGQALLDRRKHPTAIFVANDMMAIGVLNTARRLGLNVPEDLSIIGFDDISLAACTAPGLTTVAQPKYRMGQRTAEILLNRIRKPQSPIISESLTTHLVERESHGPVKQGVKK